MRVVARPADGFDMLRCGGRRARSRSLPPSLQVFDFPRDTASRFSTSTGGRVPQPRPSATALSWSATRRQCTRSVTGQCRPAGWCPTAATGRRATTSLTRSGSSASRLMTLIDGGHYARSLEHERAMVRLWLDTSRHLSGHVCVARLRELSRPGPASGRHGGIARCGKCHAHEYDDPQLGYVKDIPLR